MWFINPCYSGSPIVVTGFVALGSPICTYCSLVFVIVVHWSAVDMAHWSATAVVIAVVAVVPNHAVETAKTVGAASTLDVVDVVDTVDSYWRCWKWLKLLWFWHCWSLLTLLTTVGAVETVDNCWRCWMLSIAVRVVESSSLDCSPCALSLILLQVACSIPFWK